jgi:hypothetical protein
VQYRLRQLVKDPDWDKWRRLKATYNLTKKQFLDLVNQQQGCCAICKNPTQDWCVDHDHACCPGDKSCGRCIRGLLCVHCNTGLGYFKDNITALIAAAHYIESAVKEVI